MATFALTTGPDTFVGGPEDNTELTINLKPAKALGLTVPLIMQMTADEVIE